MKKFKGYLTTVWKDPVWSKIISVIIIGSVLGVWNFVIVPSPKRSTNRETTRLTKDNLPASRQKNTGKRMILTFLDCSVSQTEALQRYIGIIQKSILIKIRPSDIFVLLPIDKGSKLKPEKLAYYNFSSNTDEILTYSEKVRFLKSLDKFKLSLPNIVDEKISERKAFLESSDILGALEESRQYLDTMNKNIIIIFSDMIQESRDFSFSNIQSDVQIRGYLENLSGLNKIPDLQNCSVIVEGATGLNNNHVDLIRSFWHSYFDKTKAKFSSYSYDNSMAIEELLE